MRTIKDKISVVTGAGSGLGRAIALRLADEGAHLDLVDINEAAAEETAREVRKRGVKVAVNLCDLADPQAIDQLAASLIQRWGHIDILINNAGLAWYGPTVAMEQSEWERLLAVNLHAPIRLTTMLLPHLLSREEAHVVNMASICGWICGQRFAAYCVSKHALVGFSEALRCELLQHGLGVTAVCPGPVLTPLYKNAPCGYADHQTPDPPAWMCTTIDRVAAKTIRAIYRNQAVTFVGWVAHALYLAKRFAPGLLYTLHHLFRKKIVREKMEALARDPAFFFTKHERYKSHYPSNLDEAANESVYDGSDTVPDDRPAPKAMTS